MKIKIFLFLFFLLLSITLTGQTRGVVKSIPSPDFPYGLTFDGNYLWVGCSDANSADMLWKVDTADGSIVDSIPVPNPNGFYKVKALTYDGQYLWVFEDLPSSSHPDKFYKVDPNTGTVLDSFNSPVNNFVGGMCWVNGDIWFSFYSSLDGLIKIDTLGTSLDTIITQGEQPMGVAYDGQYLWCAEDTGFGSTKQEIYQYDPISGTYTGIYIRNPDLSPRDMTWDGQYLWLIGYSPRLIYKIDIQGGTPNINVTDSIDFGLVEIGDTGSVDITVSNIGSDTLVIDSLVFDQIYFYSDSVNIPIVLPESSSFILPVKFSPTNYGVHTGIMDIYSNDPLDSVVTVHLEGVGLYSDPTLYCSPGYINFGNVWVGQDGSTSRMLYLINQGNLTLSLDSFEFFWGGFSFESPPLPFDISPNDSILTRIWFTPQYPTHYFDTLVFFSGDSVTGLINMSGDGISDSFDLGYQFWFYNTPDNPYGGNYDKRVEGLKAMGDVNSDGVKDVVISTENYLTICLNGASAGLADTFWAFNTGIDNNNTGSISLNGMFSAQKAIQIASDLNGDGISDVVIGTDGGNEHVYAISGVDGTEIWSYGDNNDPYLGGFGAIDVRRDFNGDSIVDVLAVSSSNNSGAGHKSVYCFNGTNGNIIWQYPITVSGRASGYSIISIEDITGDGISDCIAGYGGDDYIQFARAINGSTGLFIWEFNATVNGAKEMLEFHVTDSTPDVIIADYWGDIYRVDGESGQQIWHSDISGGVIQMELIPDINGNGYDDIIIANFTQGTGVICLDGGNGLNILSISTSDYRTYGVISIPDIDGDGISEIVTGDQSGWLYIYSAGVDSLIYSDSFPNRIYTVNWLSSIDGDGYPELLVGLDNGYVSCISTNTGNVGVEENPEIQMPVIFSLGNNYPNPFKETTTIRFSLPEQVKVSLKVYNSAGQLVQIILDNEVFFPGIHNIEFKPENMRSGIYFYRLNAGNFINL